MVSADVSVSVTSFVIVSVTSSVVVSETASVLSEAQPASRSADSTNGIAVYPVFS
ncbi:MAG: hypothetical protein IJZ72_08870 [Oscillospiraceae bacterium]|nr:hypothetical protein [Oscillospiraceae bacterium]